MKKKKRFARNILKLFATTLLLAACSTTKIPNVRFYAEIPFQDCPEGVYVESVTKRSGIINCEKWAEMRPFMVMVDPEGKKKIFNNWTEACRLAGKSCKVQLQGVKSTVEKLDKLAEKVLKPIVGE